MCFMLSMCVFIFVICVNRVTYLPEGRVVLGYSCCADRDEARGTGHIDISLTALG